MDMSQMQIVSSWFRLHRDKFLLNYWVSSCSCRSSKPALCGSDPPLIENANVLQ